MNARLLKFAFSVFFLTGFMGTIKATTYTVDNKTGSAAQYTDLQVAIDAAQPGDTILVAHSETSYGNILLNKRLVLLGEGYTSPSTTELNYLIVRNESPSIGLNASGSLISGFYINGAINTSSGVYRYVSLAIEGANTNVISNITITRVRVTWGTHLSSFNNVLLYNNILNSVGYAPLQNGVYGDYTFGSNLELHNNILDELPRLKGGVLFKNNIFIGANQVYDLFFGGVGINGAVSDVILENNILWGFGTAGATGSTFNNNLVATSEGGETFSYGDNVSSSNIENDDPEFIGAPANFTFDLNADFNISQTSPAKTGGVNGGELGIYGGDYPWPGNLILVPAGPTVTEIKPISSPSVPAGGTIEFRFKSTIIE